MLIRVPVSVYDENTDSPLYAEAEFKQDQINRIVDLADQVERLSVRRIVEFGRPDSFFEEDYDAEELVEDRVFKEMDFRTEASVMNVYKDRATFGGLKKHTNVSWETDSIPLEQLVSALDVVDLFASSESN